MEQLLAHLVGDYLLQTDAMATRKTERTVWAMVHAAVYTLPFLFLTHSWRALAVICLTHLVIDRFRLARYVVAAKNSVTDWNRRAEFFGAPILTAKVGTAPLRSTTGYGVDAPPWLATWLLIIGDNTMHLCINYAALRWLG